MTISRNACEESGGIGRTREESGGIGRNREEWVLMANGCYVYNFKDFLVKSKQRANFGDKKIHSESGQNSSFHNF